VPALGPCGQHVAAHPGFVDLLVQVGEFFVPAGHVFAAYLVGVPGGLGVGACLDQP